MLLRPQLTARVSLLADWDECSVRGPVETRPLCDPQLDTVQAGVVGHDRCRAVLEPDLDGILEGVVAERCAVCRGDLDALNATDQGVPLEVVVLRSPRFRHPWIIGPSVDENVVPGDNRWLGFGTVVGFARS